MDSQWEFAVWLRELRQGLCDNPEGWNGKEMEGRFGREGPWVYLYMGAPNHGWLILVDVIYVYYIYYLYEIMYI